MSEVLLQTQAPSHPLATYGNIFNNNLDREKDHTLVVRQVLACKADARSVDLYHGLPDEVVLQAGHNKLATEFKNAAAEHTEEHGTSSNAEEHDATISDSEARASSVSGEQEASTDRRHSIQVAEWD